MLAFNLIFALIPLLALSAPLPNPQKGPSGSSSDLGGLKPAGIESKSPLGALPGKAAIQTNQLARSSAAPAGNSDPSRGNLGTNTNLTGGNNGLNVEQKIGSNLIVSAGTTISPTNKVDGVMLSGLQTIPFGKNTQATVGGSVASNGLATVGGSVTHNTNGGASIGAGATVTNTGVTVVNAGASAPLGSNGFGSVEFKNQSGPFNQKETSVSGKVGISF